MLYRISETDPGAEPGASTLEHVYCVACWGRIRIDVRNKGKVFVHDGSDVTDRFINANGNVSMNQKTVLTAANSRTRRRKMVANAA